MYTCYELKCEFENEFNPDINSLTAHEGKKKDRVGCQLKNTQSCSVV